MLEPFLTASPTAKLVNLLILIFAFLAWVSTMVAFSSPLHTTALVTLNGTVDASSSNVYWNSASLAGRTLPLRDSCKSAGDGWIAMNVFAFLITLPLFFGTLFRLLGLSLPVIGDELERQLKFEFFASAATNFFFFLAICTWGGACYSQSTISMSVGGITEGWKQESLTPVGFGLELAVFFFLFLNLSLLYFMRITRPEWQVGKGGTTNSSDNYAPRSEYDAPASTPETFSYSSS